MYSPENGINPKAGQLILGFPDTDGIGLDACAPLAQQTNTWCTNQLRKHKKHSFPSLALPHIVLALEQTNEVFALIFGLSYYFAANFVWKNAICLSQSE